MPYQPVPQGTELFDGTNVNFVSDALNAQAIAASLPTNLQLPRHQPGYRMMTGDFFTNMDILTRALGKTSPVTASNQKGLQIGHRLFTGDLLNKFAKAAGVY